VSKPFYNTVWTVGSFIFLQSSRPTVLHLDRVPRTGPFILAANHTSPFDAALLIRHTPRYLHFMTMAELLHGNMRWFFRGMNCVPLHRSRRDPAAARAAVEHLHAGRPVGIFPEGRLRPPENSVTAGAPFNPGLLKLSMMTDAPILPAVLYDTRPYLKWHAWLPTRSVRYGLIYGEPFRVTSESEGLATLSAAFQSLHRELTASMPART
jgi:1-acyl-sn-glycerol-3-phosphate acyltransferase